MRKNPSLFSSTGPFKNRFADHATEDYPVEHVSWLEAIQFCNALSKEDGLQAYYEVAGSGVRVHSKASSGYRLPTEAEWEYACRAGAKTRFSFGKNETEMGQWEWFNGNSEFKSHPVGQLRKNAFGLYDMQGNVMEWCWDGFDKTYYATSPELDPQGPPWSSLRVIRGGCWLASPRNCRSAIRLSHAQDVQSDDLGFRVARSQPTR